MAGIVLHIRAEHGGVGHHIEFRGEHIVQARDGLFERALGTHHFIVDLWHAGFDCDLYVIETRFDELLDIFHIREAASICVQTCDLSIGFGVGYQLWQIISQSCFSASEDDVRHAQAPKAGQ